MGAHFRDTWLSLSPGTFLPPVGLGLGCPAQLAHPGVFHWSFQDENPRPPQNPDSSQVLQLCLRQLLLLFQELLEISVLASKPLESRQLFAN